MKTSSKMLFFCMMIISTIMVMSSSSWINMWVGMEINLMSFIPLMFSPKNSFLSQSMMMYFLTQSMASAMFIMILLFNKNNFIMMSENMMNYIILFIMMMKMGMPPFHMWLPEIMSKINWMTCVILMTWQKLAPIYVISMIMEMKPTIIMTICISTLMGAIGGLNQTSTKKIMAYSSMNHMGWLMSCATMYKKSWMLYMILYSLIILMMSMLFYEYNVNFINQMSIFLSKKMEKITMITMMLSLGGLPPFLGFLPKWIAIQNMITSKEMLMMLVMVMSSLVTLSYYLRMTSSMNLMISKSQKWMKMSVTNKYMSMYILTLNLMLPAFIMFLNFM